MQNVAVPGFIKNAQQIELRFAEIALPLPLRQTFTYSLPLALQDGVKIGARLLVSFGKRQLTGYIVALHENLSEEIEFEIEAVKDALELLDDVPLVTEEILKLTQWTADYYSASWGEILKASLPAGVNSTSEQIVSITAYGRDELLKISTAKLTTTKAQILKLLSETEEVSMRELGKKFGVSTAQRAVRELGKLNWISTFQRTLTTKVKPKRRKAVRLLPPEFHAANVKPLTEAQSRIIEILIEENGDVGFTELVEKADASASAIQTLEKRGFLQTFVREVFRDPLKDARIPDVQNLILNTEQAQVFAEIEMALKAKNYKAFLLHGVTGSGKTEIYIRAMKAALSMSKTALMLVPEIALTPVFSRRLRAVFGEEVAILHSNLSTGERFDEWRRIRRRKSL
jgi:primosomal protein N' (replication factor Y)